MTLKCPFCSAPITKPVYKPPKRTKRLYKAMKENKWSVHFLSSVNKSKVLP